MQQMDAKSCGEARVFKRIMTMRKHNRTGNEYVIRQERKNTLEDLLLLD